MSQKTQSHTPFLDHNPAHDEFADPSLREFSSPPTLGERFVRSFTEMGVFPIAITAFGAMAGYGIYKYRRLPQRDPISTTLYFTGLRIAAQSLAVGIIAVGAVSHFIKNYNNPQEEQHRNRR